MDYQELETLRQTRHVEEGLFGMIYDYVRPSFILADTSVQYEQRVFKELDGLGYSLFQYPYSIAGGMQLSLHNFVTNQPIYEIPYHAEHYCPINITLLEEDEQIKIYLGDEENGYPIKECISGQITRQSEQCYNNVCRLYATSTQLFIINDDNGNDTTYLTIMDINTFTEMNSFKINVGAVEDMFVSADNKIYITSNFYMYIYEFNGQCQVIGYDDLYGPISHSCMTKDCQYIILYHNNKIQIVQRDTMEIVRTIEFDGNIYICGGITADKNSIYIVAIEDYFPQVRKIYQIRTI